jgi:hypothetical protein
LFSELPRRVLLGNPPMRSVGLAAKSVPFQPC